MAAECHCWLVQQCLQRGGFRHPLTLLGSFLAIEGDSVCQEQPPSPTLPEEGEGAKRFINIFAAARKIMPRFTRKRGTVGAVNCLAMNRLRVRRRGRLIGRLAGRGRLVPRRL